MDDFASTFFCVDGHTCGNPVRLVAGGGPFLVGDTMSAKRQDFLTRYDWIRRALMFEPRGHDMMSGAIFYPPTTPDGDVSILYIETSGCLPMCGHGTIGAITMGLEHGLIRPRQPGVVLIDTPAGRVRAEYRAEGGLVEEVRLYNVASYLDRAGLEIDLPGLGILQLDIAYGGNFYAIIDSQKNFSGLESLNAGDILRLSPMVRELARQAYTPVHFADPTIQGISHVMWTGAVLDPVHHGRNAVFYGDRAIDRSPCGTGTSARMAQLHALGKLAEGADFHHESYIGSVFKGRVECVETLEGGTVIQPSFAGWARQTGINTIRVDARDPFHHGFQVL